MEKYTFLTVPLFALALCLLAWEVAVHVFSIATWILPAPSQIARALWLNKLLLLPHILYTLLAVAIGLACAIATALFVAAALDYSAALRRILYPLLVFSQTIPIIALAPLLVVWFGFDITPKVIIVTLFCFFPITINTSDGLAATDRDALDFFLSMNARWWHIWYKLRLPTALPYFFSGLKVAATYCVLAAVVGEWTGSEKGLGLYLLRSAASFQTDQVFAAIAVIALLSIALFGCVFLVERICTPWNTDSLSK